MITLSEVFKRRLSLPSPPFKVPEREPVEEIVALSSPSARSISLIFVNAVPSRVPELIPVIEILLELEFKVILFV